MSRSAVYSIAALRSRARPAPAARWPTLPLAGASTAWPPSTARSSANSDCRQRPCASVVPAGQADQPGIRPVALHGVRCRTALVRQRMRQRLDNAAWFEWPVSAHLRRLRPGNRVAALRSMICRSRRGERARAVAPYPTLRPGVPLGHDDPTQSCNSPALDRAASTEG